MGIYQPNNHSQWQIRYKQPTDNDLFAVKGIVSQFFLQPITSILQVDEANTNSNNFLVHIQGADPVLFRRYVTVRDRERLQFTHDLINYLKDKGAAVPELLRAKGKSLIEHDGYFWSGFSYFQGNHYKGTLEELQAVARAVAQLHILIKDCPQKEALMQTLKQTHNYMLVNDYSEKVMQPLIVAMKQKQDKDEIDQFVDEHLDYILSAMKQTEHTMSGVKDLVQQVIHTDLHPHNILINNGQVLLLDLDAARVSELARDVSFVLFRLGRQLIAHELQEGRLQQDGIKIRVAQVIDTFLDAYLAVNPIPDQDIKALVPIMYDEICKKLVFVFTERYVKHDYKWSKEIPKFTAFLKEISYFDTGRLSQRSMAKTQLYLEEFPKFMPGGGNAMSKFPNQFVQGVSPAVLSHGDGCYVWDVDGHKYIEMGLALGPMTLGYKHPAVDAAVIEQIDKGTIFVLPHESELKLAKKLIKVVPCAERVRFCLNGCDATTAAIRVARAFTGKNHIAKCGYHGWVDWTIATKQGRNMGVPGEVKQLTHDFKYNDPVSLEIICEEYPIAAVILEPVNITPPKDDFLNKVKAICEKHGAVLIFDEIITGFRWALGGAQSYYGVVPDLCAMSKGMSNGYPVSAVMGRAEIMDLFTKVFCSTTLGGYANGVAAALATIDVMEKEPVFTHIWELGNYFIQEANKILEDLPVRIGGLAPHPMFITDIPDELQDREMKSLWMQEMHKRGVLLHTSMLIGYCHKKEHIDEVLDKLKEAAVVMKKAWEEKNFVKYLEGPVIAPRARKHA